MTAKPSREVLSTSSAEAALAHPCFAQGRQAHLMKGLREHFLRVLRWRQYGVGIRMDGRHVCSFRFLQLDSGIPLAGTTLSGAHGGVCWSKASGLNDGKRVVYPKSSHPTRYCRMRPYVH